MTFISRDATESDLPEIVRIYNATIPSRMVTADLEPVSVDLRLEWFHHHHPKYRPLWVVDIDNTIAAWLSFESFYGRPAYNQTAELSIYVDSSFQRQGLGRFLLNQAISRHEEYNINTFLGFIFSHNYPSLALFESLGFTPWGQLPNVAVLDGIERSLTIMGKRVAP